MKKTLTFAVLHFSVAFTLAYLLTGDIILGSLIAMIEPMVNTVAFYFHDKVWQRNKLLKIALQAPSKKTMSFAVLHFSVAFLVTYLLTGDAFIGGLMATIEPSVNTVVFYFHERFWQRKQNIQFTLQCHHHDLQQHSQELSEPQLKKSTISA
ncbi:DUF2061 domain-containing protein [Vibrio sp. S17_S38]|uniref:DUF2061 domain-containing protein n=1 Tax=Vibrio sp. S17_S38 TaxID=2720229 RepID=UPI00167FED7A|nr:DUF2061 domain-containing protein [Vibrio sp. S17_S38]MBD1572469.1 DUF2061 domain-containing protein [Vibrio sp. S17_S38]